MTGAAVTAEAPWANPVTLEGSRVLLKPLSEDHTLELAEAAADGDLSRLWYTRVPSPNDMRLSIRQRLQLQQSGAWIPFAAIDRMTNRAVGMTSFLHIVPHVRRLEIGGTWYRLSAQRTGINVESKWLLLRHAFEGLNCVAVEFRTHRFNRQSQLAIEALGARLDGVLRNHYDPFGVVRDTYVYSIISSEWPQVKAHLEWRLTRYPVRRADWMAVR
jgi:RimJ/RimL family protein N-acetyltransferase